MPNARFIALPGGEHGAVSADKHSLDTILSFVLAHAAGAGGQPAQKVLSGDA